MSWKGFTLQVTSAVALAGGLALLGQSFAAAHLSQLQTWRRLAVTAPEGAAAQALFDRAVAAEAIAWDPDQHAVVLRRDVTLEDDLRIPLFKVGEAGAVIAAEIARTDAQNRLIALRARHRDCLRACDAVEWTVAAAQAPLGTAEALALGASLSRTQGVQAPLPRLNYALSRDAGVGYGPWRSWAAQGPLRFETQARGLDQIDVAGRVDTAPPGWTIQSRWCRNAAGRLAQCKEGQTTAAVRLVPQGGGLGQGPVTLTVAPVPVFPAVPADGSHKLSERLSVTCAAGACRPEWVPQPGARRYASATPQTHAQPQTPGASEAPPEVAADLAPARRALGAWAVAQDTGLVASDLAVSTGAMPILGGAPLPRGALLAAARDLQPGDGRRISLDPAAQKITHDVLRDLLDRPTGGAFERLNYQFPQEGPRVSLVVLDLREGGVPGAILASAGVPTPPQGVSGWDAAAAPYDAGRGVPPGPSAWTGRGSHHIPGSTWKLVTALALIDAATDPALPLPDAEDLREVLLGVDAAQADVRLGQGVLTGAAGICPPRRLMDGPRGASSLNGCGADHLKPIRDSGRGGPLQFDSLARYGLIEAVAKSSNIWFTAALLRAERDRVRAGAPGGSVMRHTAERLGLLAAAPLDGGLGLALDPRDAAEIAALAAPADMGKLARSSFGQEVQAGPLVTAQIAGSIATGLDLRPSLLVPMPAPGALFEAPMALPLLDNLQEGMRLVVQSANAHGFGAGTAYGPFGQQAPEIRDRAFGKTGTADRGLGNRDRISAFAGWLSDDANKPRFAVSCSATVLGRRTSTNAVSVTPVCAHAAAEIMKRLDQEETLK